MIYTTFLHTVGNTIVVNWKEPIYTWEREENDYGGI